MQAQYDEIKLKRFAIYNLLTDEYKELFQAKIRQAKEELLQFEAALKAEMEINPDPDKEFDLFSEQISFEVSLYFLSQEIYSRQLKEIGGNKCCYKAVDDFMKKIKGIYSE